MTNGFDDGRVYEAKCGERPSPERLALLEAVVDAAKEILYGEADDEYIVVDGRSLLTAVNALLDYDKEVGR